MSSSKLRVAVLFGGRSAEHEISLLSARFVVEMLDRNRFEPILIGIDKDGRWLLQQEALLLGATRDPRLQKLNQSAPDVALATHPSSTGNVSLAIGSGEKRSIDVVFPVLHGPMGEDGTVQGLLELAGVPYVGSGVLGSAVGMDKDVMKRLLKDAGLPMVPHVVIRRSAWDRNRAAAIASCADLGDVVFVKPANLGSSVGVTRVKRGDDLGAAIDHAFELDLKVVVEGGLDHPREIECAVLGDDDEAHASIAGEIVVDHQDGFYSYAAKYIDEHGVTTRVPADLSAEQMAHVQSLALKTFAALEGSGLARVDLFLDKSGQFYVNEINTLPGFTAISMYPKLWAASGVPGEKLVAKLIDLALKRAAQKAKLRTSV
ncbi:MAG: D-alanine--D-alanine ligase [Polyangiaceae bacterium]|nr:D-alanine--D-alanine ligase [Polyangiaceae bacterium]